MYIHRDEDGRLSNAGRPALEIAGCRQWWFRGRLHREDGPAVETDFGTERYYWRGVHVPEHVVMNPRSKDIQHILQEENVEVRRAWLESYGLDEAIEHLAKNGGAELLDETKEPPRRLWKLSSVMDVDERHPVYVEVTCPSTDRRYFLRVHPDMNNCAEAVASTFQGVSEEQYALAVES